MIKSLLFILFLFVALPLGLCAVVVLPFLLIGAVFKLLLTLLVLPFRLVGLVIGAVGAILGGLFKLLFGGLALLLVVGLFTGGALLIVGLPLLLLVLGGWLLFKLLAPASAIVAT